MTPAVEAAKSAASVMAMNNVYYRFVHLPSNPEYKTNAGSAADELARQSLCGQNRFRAVGLAVSAINGCGACNAHEKTLRQVGASLGYNSNGVRFAAIVQSVAVASEAARHGTSQRAE